MHWIHVVVLKLRLKLQGIEYYQYILWIDAEVEHFCEAIEPEREFLLGGLCRIRIDNALWRPCRRRPALSVVRFAGMPSRSFRYRPAAQNDRPHRRAGRACVRWCGRSSGLKCASSSSTVVVESPTSVSRPPITPAIATGFSASAMMSMLGIRVRILCRRYW